MTRLPAVAQLLVLITIAVAPSRSDAQGEKTRKPAPVPAPVLAPPPQQVSRPGALPAAVNAGGLQTPLMSKYPPPSSLSAAQTGAGTVQLSWPAVPGASYYKVTGAGIAAAGVRASTTNQSVTGVASPGIQTWKVAAYFVTPTGDAGSAPVTQSIWVKASTSGLAAPLLPAPSFQLKSFNDDEGAKNDQQGRTAYTSLALNQNPQACPYTPMFVYDGAQAPIPAAGFYLTASGQVEPDTDPAYNKYSILNNGILYFRAPTFPGLKYVRPPAYNTWVYVVNCRGEYSNALHFRVYPTNLQLQFVTPTRFIGGQQVNLFGAGFAGITPTDQKVLFHVTLGRTNAAGNALDQTVRDIEASPAFPQGGAQQLLNERQINVLAPNLDGLGYGPSSGYILLDAQVYVTRGGIPTAKLPVTICRNDASAAQISGTGPC
jgi:hypothetical protein